MSPHPDWNEAGMLVLYRLDELDKVRAEHTRVLAILQDKIEGKLKQDLDQAHEKIRKLAGKNSEYKIKFWVAVSAASFLSTIVTILLGTLLKILFK